MAEWPFVNHDWSPDWPGPYPYETYGYGNNAYYQEKAPPPLNEGYEPQAQPYQPAAAPPSPGQAMLTSPPVLSPVPPAPQFEYPPAPIPKGENPRELRNKAEKQRRDKLNQSIEKLSSMVPPVVNANKKFDKTSVLRYTAHYLRAHQYVFGDAIKKTSEQQEQELDAGGAQAILGFLNGFLLTTTYKGLVVVVSKNVQQHLGYNEVDLLGQSIFKIIHPDDVHTIEEQLMPPSHFLGPHGELVAPNEPKERQKVFNALQNEKRKFAVRFKKFGQKSDPPQFVSCLVEGSMRKSDAASRGYNRCCQMVRRARARGDNPYSSGNDIVFIGVVRPICETFISEREMESFKMEYRTRHLVDGEIIQCEQRIALVTGYMTQEVNGVNAMNFMHRDDVRWVIIALRQMYDENLLIGESCYRLMAKNGDFIYMRTRGQLDVEDESRAVRTFVCTNTVVDEREGKHLIKMMKRKFQCMINGTEAVIDDDDLKEDEKTDNSTVPIENPRCLEKVILHLVTNLPSPQPEAFGSESPDRGCSPSLPLAIIPPKKERILGAIEKIYTVIKALQKNMTNEKTEEQMDKCYESELENFDSVSLLAHRPVQDIATVLTSEQMTLLNNNNLLLNESWALNGTAAFEELKKFIPSSCQANSIIDLAPHSSEPNLALEYNSNSVRHAILKPQPTYAIGQSGPSVAKKRTCDILEAHATAKRKAGTYQPVTSTVTNLDRHSSEMKDLYPQHNAKRNTQVMVYDDFKTKFMSVQGMDTHCINAQEMYSRGMYTQSVMNDQNMNISGRNVEHINSQYMHSQAMMTHQDMTSQTMSRDSQNDFEKIEVDDEAAPRFESFNGVEFLLLDCNNSENGA